MKDYVFSNNKVLENKRSRRQAWGQLLLTAVVFVLLTIIITSCASDTELDNMGDGLANSELTELSMDLIPPGDFTPTATRALTPNEQNKVLRATVLQFKTGTVVRYGVVDNVTSNQTLRVVLKSSQAENDFFDIHVIANDPTTDPETYMGKTMAQVKTMLTLKLEPTLANDDYWKTRGIPMWGEAKQQLIKPTANTLKIRLLRSLATIDLGLGTFDQLTKTWSGLPIFKLTYVAVMNVRDKVSIIPSATKIDESGSIVVTEPDVPTGSGLLGTTPATALNYSAGIDANRNQIRSSIFISEANNSTGNANERVILLIGGSYKNGPTSYYRIDVTDPDSQTPTYSILRNHAYRFTITNIVSPGLSSPAAAFDAGPSLQVKSSLTPVDEGQSGDIIFNNNYYLSTSRSNVRLYTDGAAGPTEYEIATVKATFPTGSPNTIVASSKITLTGATSLINGTSVTIKARIPSGTATHTITVTAGGLIKVINITTSNK